jgi:predicted enzyme related to lactoylglutathione lyase
MTNPSPPTLRTGKLCYLEIPALDVHRSAAFYEQAFGWTIRQRDSDRPSFDDTTGEVSGAWVLDRAPAAVPGILPYIMVADATAAVGSVVAAGGQIVTPAGQYGTEVIATFRDPAGNLMGIYQQPGLRETEV